MWKETDSREGENSEAEMWRGGKGKKKKEREIKKVRQGGMNVSSKPIILLRS